MGKSRPVKPIDFFNNTINQTGEPKVNSRFCPIRNCRPEKLHHRLIKHGIAGGLFGYIILHPISMVVHDIFHLTSAKIWRAVYVSFTAEHFSMTIYFTLIGFVFGLFHGTYIHYISRLHEQLRRLSITDELTALYNYRYFRNYLEQEFARARRYRRSLSLLMLDIDHFKQYNDTNGHQAGDQLLRTLAQLIRSLTRDTDSAARYGGEEFTVVMPETNKNEAYNLAGRICAAVEDYPFENEQLQPGGKVTVSIGVAEYPEDAQNISNLIKKADDSLYMAKEKGRNQVW